MERGKMNINHSAQTGAISVQIELINGTVWLTKQEISQAFDVLVPMVTANLRVIFGTKELFEHEVVKRHTYTRENGQVCYTELYNLDVVIALAFRMRGGYCRAFREWPAGAGQTPDSSKHTATDHYSVREICFDTKLIGNIC